MPKYYFHLHNSTDVTDLEGTEFPDLEDAKVYAASLARFEVGESAKREGRIVRYHRIDIEDSRGAVLATVTFGEAVIIQE